MEDVTIIEDSIGAATAAAQASPRQHVIAASAAMAKGSAATNHASHDNSDNEGSNNVRDDPEDGAGTPVSSRGEATATYTAPPHDRVEKLALHGVLQPRVPELGKLMELVTWRRGILFAMGPEGMASAGTGLAHLDKGMADEIGLRIVRSFELNKEDEFVDHDLEKHALLLFTLLKIIMEEHEFDHFTLQKMLNQKMHCDPHCKHAKPERDAQECHVLLTVN
jgi:hypothetical protein